MDEKQMVMEHLVDRRFVYYVPATDFFPKKGGYRAAIVFENVRGYYPTDWYWGKDLKKAQEVARKMNEERGISKDDEFNIIGSSMFNTISGKLK